MTPDEITKMVNEETEAIMDSICSPYERRITELRRQLKWCFRVIGFMQASVIVLAIIVMIWALFQ